VSLVDTRELARVPGRSKTDRRDCEGMQRLHSSGLLKRAFRPAEQICPRRGLVRDRANLVAEQGDWWRRMPKSLDPMKMHGPSRNGTEPPEWPSFEPSSRENGRKLAKLRDPRSQQTEEQIAEQLTGP